MEGEGGEEGDDEGEVEGVADDDGRNDLEIEL